MLNLRQDGHYQAARNSKSAPTECMGLRCVHERTTSARNCMPRRKVAWLTLLAGGMAESALLKTFHPGNSVSVAGAESRAHTVVLCSRKTSEAQVFAQG